MICKLHLCIAVLLTVLEVMLGHPVVQTGDMTYGRPVLVEDDQLVSPEDLSYSEQAFLSQGSAGFGYPSIITGDLSRDNNGVKELFVQTSFCVHPNKDIYEALEQLESIRTAGFVPGQALKEVLLEKPLMNPLSRFLGGRKQYHKRGSNTECFWKYCV